MNDVIVELKNVLKHFNERVILRNVNLSLSTAETISIVGASGSGKTTLLNIISLLEFPDEGEVYWHGTLVSKLPRQKILKLRGHKFGFIFQNHNLISELNVLENILLPVKIHRRIKKTDVTYAADLLKKVGLLDRKNSQVSYLSGGEKQRVAVIRALMNRPQVILADEPTGNLDENNARVVIDLMFELCRSIGSSLVLITHNDALSKLTEKKYLLLNGRLIQQ